MNVPDSPDSPHFFISYTAVDEAWAEWIAWRLEDAGYRVLVQAWDFIPGTNWMVGMQQGVMKAARTVALLSPAYLRSVYGQAEWQAALAADPLGFARKLIPIRIADCPRPGLLGQIVSFDLFGLSADDAAARLTEQIAFLHTGRAKPAATPAFPVPSTARPPSPAPGSARPGPPSVPVSSPRAWPGVPGSSGQPGTDPADRFSGTRGAAAPEVVPTGPAADRGAGSKPDARPGPVRNHPVVTGILAARVRARSLGRLLREGLGGPTSSGLVLPRDDATSRDAEFDEARAVALDLSRDLAGVLTLVRGGDDTAARDHAPSLGFAADLARSVADDLHTFLDAEEIERVVATTRRVSARLATVPLDASGADLSRLDVADPRPDELARLTAATIWDSATRWPAAIADRVRAQSVEVRPGTFQIVVPEDDDESA